ncbi:hypothetical protein AJ79_07414 [Helicocarpus griseus UAMH5409]|uniref:Uncharacterized protein n=1 Tax=Helicocarpus griseus UAMH5409 TaxID=1447875 RepID=A0A2B7X2W2_9EURO|nr:hypothetical protein AJ79_07414 [Helicocarpus griseus UAMH5409]
MRVSMLSFLPLFPLSIADYCPPTGPVLPPPSIPENFAQKELNEVLEHFVKHSSDYGWNATVNSFSVSATSREETFFSNHYTAPLKNDTGVDKVAGDTVYRIASGTKVFTVLAVLLEDRINLEDPIGKYVKELQGEEYGDVTVRLLTNQLAALPREGYTWDKAVAADKLVPLGFPQLAPSDVPPCGTGVGDRICTREEFFKAMPGFTGQIANTVAYSNVAYSILGYALEDVTGMKYAEVIKQKITEPLGLPDIAAKAPKTERGILPINNGPWFELDLEYVTPTAGLYATPNHLDKFLRSILNNTLLSNVKTNEWLKPAAFTSKLEESVGAPWEIFRPRGLTNPPRPIDHYTKSGDLPGFSSSYIVLVPEYNLGVTLLSAGPEASSIVAMLLDIFQGTLVPKLEKLAREQAQEVYGGKYEAQSKDTNSSASIELVVDKGPGLKVKEWKNNDKDMLQSFYLTILGGAKKGDEPLEADVRFYPLGVDDRWRVVFNEPEGKNEKRKGGKNRGGKKLLGAMREDACLTWFRVDGTRYGKIPLDEVVFRVEDGAVKRVDAPGLRAEMDKM